MEFQGKEEELKGHGMNATVNSAMRSRNGAANIKTVVCKCLSVREAIKLYYTWERGVIGNWEMPVTKI